MRHRRNTLKLGRTSAHRDALLANQVCSLIEHGRIKTTLAKAKAVRPLAEKMLTLGKDATLHSRRLASARLGQKTAVKKLFDELAPRSASRNGGYTRIVKLGMRVSDSAPMAYIEWVDAPVTVEEAAPEETAKPAKAKKPKVEKAEKPKAEKAPKEEKAEKVESEPAPKEKDTE